MQGGHDPEAEIGRVLDQTRGRCLIEPDGIEAGLAEDAERRAGVTNAHQKEALAADEKMIAAQLDLIGAAIDGRSAPAWPLGRLTDLPSSSACQ